VEPDLRQARNPRQGTAYALNDHDQQPTGTTEEPIFHSDRGSNYTSSSFSAALAEHGARQSVGRTGICYDNAMAESFFGTLKNERVHRTVYPTRERARADIAQYIELRYNSRRIHSGLGYRTPQEVHDAWLNSQEAA
jgi:transposase InsO family protein